MPFRAGSEREVKVVGAALSPEVLAAAATLSAIVLLLVAPVQLAQLLLPKPSSLVGLGGAAGAGGLGRLGAVAARRRPLEEVLGDATLQVLHGGRRGHADDPRVLQGLSGGQPLAGVHRQDPLHKILGQVGHAGPRLHAEQTSVSKRDNSTERLTVCVHSGPSPPSLVRFLRFIKRSSQSPRR